MKHLFITLLAIFCLATYAHEQGHGDLKEGGKFGGITAPVVQEAHAGHSHGQPMFKAELVRSEDGTLRVYLFDNKMNLLPLTDFSETILAKLEVKKKGKFTYFGEVIFTKSTNHFLSKLPKVEFKPFNIDMFFANKKQKLFVGFSNLD